MPERSREGRARPRLRAVTRVWGGPGVPVPVPDPDPDPQGQRDGPAAALEPVSQRPSPGNPGQAPAGRAAVARALAPPTQHREAPNSLRRLWLLR